MNDSSGRARDLFGNALEIPSESERAAYLEQNCAGDAALRQEVVELLAAHRNADEFMTQPFATLGASAPPAVEAEEEMGATIGRYKVLEKLGEGGFGTVYVAEQKEPVRRRVALKILKLGMDTRQVVARFQAERQALALMDHANIAKVFDAGATESGRPYFVMELVRGIAITRYCDENNLSVRARLDLFMLVCGAIQHAHQKGVIHRDIKPSNILVTLHDGTPVPRLIDFGIAKATQGELTDKTIYTQFHQFIGTPAYMSPEQAQLGPDVDTRSDIYGLGVLLYELLTGRTPFDARELMATGIDAMRRTIAEKEPARPSTNLACLKGEEQRTAAHRRATDPAMLTLILRGDLDWIVMKCLEKDRARRYETASALAMDVRRYFRNEPVEACPPTAAYRFRKFARRNKAALAVAFTVLIAASIAVTVLAVSTFLISRQRQEIRLSLRSETRAKGELSESLQRERRNSYVRLITLAQQEVLENHLLQADALLDACPPEQRAWEWFYLKRLCHAEPISFRGQPSGIQTVAFSPDGELIASASLDKTVRIWDAASGREQSALLDAGDVSCAVFHPRDGNALVTGDKAGTITLWDIRTRQRIRVVGKHKESVRCLAFNSSGEVLASASDDKTVRVWDFTAGRVIHELSGHGHKVLAVAFSPNGQLLASGGFDASVSIFDLNTGTLKQMLRGHLDPVTAVAFSPDGRRVASASLDRTAKVWDLAGVEEVLTLKGHLLQVFGVAFIDGGKRLATASLDSSLKIWDPTTGQSIITLRGHTHEVSVLTCSSDGRRLASASGDRTTRVWDANPADGRARLEAITFAGHSDQVWGLAFSPDGGRLASASWDSTVRIWDVRTAKEEFVFRNHTRRVFSVAFSGNGKRIASASVRSTADEPNPLKIWDATTGLEVLAPQSFIGEALRVAYSPLDSRWIVTSDNNGDLTVWSAVTGEVVSTLGHNGRRVTGLDFSPNGKLLAALSSEGIATIYDAQRWDKTPLLQFIAHTTSGRGALAFGADGSYLVTPGDQNTVNVWDLTDTRKQPEAPARILRGHSGQVWGVACSPDGRWIASGGEDNTVRVWDARTGDPLRTFRGHSSLVSRLAFSPDSKRVASASFDCTVKVWDLAQSIAESNR